jgi:hypothetical protein
MLIAYVTDRHGTIQGFSRGPFLPDAKPRPPLPLFAFEMLASPAVAADRVVTLCSHCQMVTWPAGTAASQGEWVDAVEFYLRGGRSALL